MLEEGSFRSRAADFVLMFVFGGFLMTVSFQSVFLSFFLFFLSLLTIYFVILYIFM